MKDKLAAVQRRIAAAAEAGELDQACAPLLEALDAYRRSDPASYSIPAHKAGRQLDDETLAVLGDGPYRDDVPAHKGLDDRADSYGIMSYAHDLAADAFGAEEAMFSTNGSTLSVQIAVVAATHPGQEVAVARNVHKSVASGLILSGADRSTSIRSTTTSSRSPCHAHDIPLIMDDAWGADFAFHPELPPGSMAAGADLSIASFHKSLTGLMQTSIILVRASASTASGCTWPSTASRRRARRRCWWPRWTRRGARWRCTGGAPRPRARAQSRRRPRDRRAARRAAARAGARRPPGGVRPRRDEDRRRRHRARDHRLAGRRLAVRAAARRARGALCTT